MPALISVSLSPGRIKPCSAISWKRRPAFVWASSNAAALESLDICIVFRWQLYSGTRDAAQQIADPRATNVAPAGMEDLMAKKCSRAFLVLTCAFCSLDGGVDKRCRSESRLTDD